MKETWHIIVSGKVQGVFYRKNTWEKAKSLGLNGWVRNLSDGRVELIASGNPENINLLKEWCKSGPENAIVKEVDSEKLKFQEFKNFEIRY